MIQAATWDDGAEGWRTERGAVKLAHPAPGVVVITYSGYIAAEFAPLVLGAIERILERTPRPDIFVDTDAITAHEPEFRKAISSGLERNGDRVGEMAILVRSKIVAMSVSLMNRIRGGKMQMTSFSARAPFQAAIDAAVRRRAARSAGGG